MEQENKDFQKLTDSGWQEMRKLLDREMPEEKRRRRPGVWFFWGAGALAVAATWFWLVKNGQPDAPKIEKSEVRPLATSPSKNDEKIGFSQNEGQPKIGISKTEKIEEPMGKPVVGNLSNPPVLTAASTAQKLGNQGSGPFSKNENQAENGTFSVDNQSIVDVSEPEKILLVSGRTVPEIFKKPENLEVRTLAALPFLPFQTFFIENKNTPPPPEKLAFDPATTKKVSTKTGFHFGLAAAGVFSNFPKPNGAAAGAFLDWRFSERWELRTGLQYQFVKYQFADAKTVSATFNGVEYHGLTGDTLSRFLDPGSTPNATVDLRDVQTVVAIPISSLHRLEMPVQLAYFPAQKWPVFVGATVSRTMRSQTDYFLTSHQNSGAAPADALTIMNAHLKKNLRAWDIFWQAGIGFRPSKWLEINALVRTNFRKTGAKSIGNWQSQNLSSVVSLADQSYSENRSFKNYSISELAPGKLVPEIQVGLRWQLH